MSEIKGRCTSADNREPWGVVDAMNCSYSIREFDAGEMDDILSETSSDLDDFGGLARKNSGKDSTSSNSRLISVGSVEGSAELPGSSESSSRNAKTTSRGITKNKAGAGTGSRFSKLQSIIIGISLVAGLINITLLTVLARDMRSFIKNNELDCDGAGGFREKLTCQFDAYMGHRAHAYETVHGKKHISPVLSTFLELPAALPALPSLPTVSVSQQYREYSSLLSSTYTRYASLCHKRIEQVYSNGNKLMQSEKVQSVKRLAGRSKQAAKDRIVAASNATKFRLNMVKEVYWPRQREWLHKLQTEVQTHTKEQYLSFKNRVQNAKDVSIPRLWHKSHDKVSTNYHRVLALLRIN